MNYFGDNEYTFTMETVKFHIVRKKESEKTAYERDSICTPNKGN